MSSVFQVELLLLFAVITLGLKLSRVKAAGVRLGPSAVLLVGLALSAWFAPTLELQIAHQLKELGLVLFVYCVGLTSGPGFFPALRSRGHWLNAGALLALLLAAGCSAVAGRVLGLDAGYVAGLFSGALTNTPALGAVAERLRGTEYAAHAALAYSVSYPFGVFGGVLLLRAFAARHRQALAALQDRLALPRTNELVTRNFEITNPEITDRSIGELRVRDTVGVLISRVGRGGESLVPTKYTLMQRGDVVTVVGPRDALAEAEKYFGAVSSQRLEASREHVDMRRILVSRRELVGTELGQLDLERRFNAQITRVRRADLDMLPSAATRLQLGDRLRVVAPVARMHQLNEFLETPSESSPRSTCLRSPWV